MNNKFTYLSNPIFALLIFICIIIFSCKPNKVHEHDYIAHAGGAIDGNMYTNSLEAVQNAIGKGIRFIELDLALTSDSQLVACHGWNEGGYWEKVPVYSEFMAHKICNRYTPIDLRRIDSIFTSNPNLQLVTDKISKPDIINSNFSKFKDRLWVECFAEDDYFTLKKMGYNVMLSKRPPTFLSAVKRLILHRTLSGFLINDYVFQGVNEEILSKRLGARFAIFGDNISRSDADDFFEKERRVRFVYIDDLE